MIYNGKEASNTMQAELRESILDLSVKPSLAVFSIATHPSIASFIKIKRRYGEAVGVEVDEFDFPESIGEDNLMHEIEKIIESKKHTGIIVQLPLPKEYNSIKILNTIPQELDVDVLSEKNWQKFISTGLPIPPVAGAVAHILTNTSTTLSDKKVVIIGHGKLVGLPVSAWFKHQGVTPSMVDITTGEDIKLKLYKEADIVVSGIGKPHHLKPEYFKEGVILIDAGTSEQAGVLAGDFDPRCAEIASIFTPVPGGVGPLTVAYLFYNLIALAKEYNQTDN